MRETTEKGILVALCMFVIIIGLTGGIINAFISSKEHDRFTYDDCNNQQCYHMIDLWSDETADRFFEGFPANGRSSSTPYIFEGIIFDFSPERNDHGLGASHCCPILENMIDISGTVRYFLIRNCTFKNVECAICFYSIDSIRIENCTFVNCNYAVRSYSSLHTIIQDCTFFNGYLAILVGESCTIQYNEIRDYDIGIQVQGNSGEIIHNEITNCTEYGISIFGNGNIIASNTLLDAYISINTESISQIQNTNRINSKLVEIIKDTTLIHFENEVLGVTYVINCSNITLTNCSANGPLFFWSSSNITLTNCSFEDIPIANTKFRSCENVSVISCNFTNGYCAIDLDSSNSSYIFDCYAGNMYYYLLGGSNVTINRNRIENITEWTPSGNSKHILNNQFINSPLYLEIVNDSDTVFENNTYNFLPIECKIDKSNFSVVPGFGFHLIYNCTNFTMNNAVFDHEDFSLRYCNKFECFNSTFHDCYSLTIRSSFNFTIDACEILHTKSNIDLNNCEEYHIVDSCCNSSQTDGIRMFSCNNFVVKNSSFNANNNAGLIVSSGRCFQITNSEFIGNENGLILLSCESTRVEFCKSYSNMDTGFMMIDIDHCTLFRNQISLNSHGMHYLWCEDFWIIENQITQNTKSGIWLLSCEEEIYRWDSFKIYNSTILDNYLDVVQQNTMLPSKTISFSNQVGKEVRVSTNTSIRTNYYSYTYRITIEVDHGCCGEIDYKTRTYGYFFFVQEYDTTYPEYLIKYGIQTIWEGFS